MNESRIRTLEQVRQFLAGAPQVSFLPRADDTQRYEHINEVVRRFSYAALGKADRGVLWHYLWVTSGYQRAQLQRLVARAINGARLHKHYQRTTSRPSSRSRDDSRPKTSSCWQRSIETLAPCPDRPRCMFSSAPMTCTTIRASSDCAPCRSRTCTTCGQRPPTNDSGCCAPRPRPAPIRSARAARPTPRDAPASSASTAFIRAIRDHLFVLIAQQQVGNRPGRIQPRAIKRRPKPYPLLMKPRTIARAHARKYGHPKKLT